MSRDIPSKVRAEVRQRSKGRCEARITARNHQCTRLAVHMHHKQRRRVDNHVAENLLDLCDPCHRWIHAHPEWARANGFIVSSFAPTPGGPNLMLDRIVNAIEWALAQLDRLPAKPTVSGQSGYPRSHVTLIEKV